MNYNESGFLKPLLVGSKVASIFNTTKEEGKWLPKPLLVASRMASIFNTTEEVKWIYLCSIPELVVLEFPYNPIGLLPD